MAALTENVKAFIVRALACYDTPSQVSEAVRDEFGIEVSRMQVASYDPTKKTARTLANKWHLIFDETRKRFLDETAAIPIANQSFRLRALQKLYEKTERRGNVVVAADLIEQAAKEVGGMFVNKMRGESEDPDPPQPRTFTYQVQDARRPAAANDSDQPDS
ncbi:DUF2280 domain-containing protein [Robbsia andropogonis]|uniref:DUF2280 domain-containing protein n=1 Tax=Robbsia andropogonis TaxID=28092 RepID=UPI003D250B03